MSLPLTQQLWLAHTLPHYHHHAHLVYLSSVTGAFNLFRMTLTSEKKNYKPQRICPCREPQS